MVEIWSHFERVAEVSADTWDYHATDANGYLMAAAPDLLRTLQNLVAAVDGLDVTNRDFNTLPAKAAIAKALHTTTEE